MTTPVVPVGRDTLLEVGDAATAAPDQQELEPDKFDAGLAARYSVANVGAQGVYTLFLTAMPFYLEGYGLNNSLIGLLSQERSFVAALVQPVVGRLSDRTRSPLGRRRPFFLIGIPLMALALLVLALHPPFWLMLGIMTVAAFFLSIAWDPYMALLADLFPPAQRGRAGGFVGLANGLGAILFLVIAFTLWGANQTLVFALVIGILVLTFGFTFLTVKETPLSGELTHEQQRSVRPNPVQYLRELRRYPEAAKYVLALTFFWLGSGGAAPFVTRFGEHALGATQAESFLLPIMFTVCTALFAVPAGYLADRIGKKQVLMGGLIVYAVAALVGSQSQNLLQGAVALAVLGIGNAGLITLNPLLTDLIPQRRVAELLGLASAVFAFAQPLGSVLAGAIVDFAKLGMSESDAFRASFIFAGGAIALAALLMRRVHPERPVPED
jgi:MFS family permease